MIFGCAPTSSRLAVWLLAGCMMAIPGGLCAQPGSKVAEDSKAGEAKAAAAKSAPDEKKSKEDSADETPPLSITAHSITVGGRLIHYHATAGYMLLQEEEGKPLVPGLPPVPGAAPAPSEKPDADDKKPKDGLKPKAKVFFVAYTLDEVKDPATRPLTFAFNGGPGSASIWLHMGSMAPRRANLTDEGEAPPPPYGVIDNESTWLDRTDLVFIDPVSTGYSRTMPKEDPHQYHGLKEDIASVGDFIRLYTTRNERWLSPKIVLGESYGTTRAAGLSDYLQGRYGIYLNGIILVSSVLSYQTLEFTPQNNDPYIGFLPTYATAAWYHRKLSPDLQARSVSDVAEEARAFVTRDYAPALEQGDRLPAADRQRIAAALSRLTSLPADYILQRKLRITDGAFFGHLLLSEGRVLGRYDARFTGLRYEPGTDIPEDGSLEYDPSDEAVNGPLTAAFNDYVRRELNYKTDIPYEGVADVQPWNFGDAGAGFPNTAEDLRHAMTRNPYLKVWVTCSYFDLATPFFAAESIVAAMNLEPAVRANLRFTYYESGHMLYIHNPSRVKFKSDFESFLQDATHQAPVHSAAR